jgi:hypothetical protein
VIIGSTGAGVVKGQLRDKTIELPPWPWRAISCHRRQARLRLDPVAEGIVSSCQGIVDILVADIIRRF